VSYDIAIVGRERETETEIDGLSYYERLCSYIPSRKYCTAEVNDDDESHIFYLDANKKTETVVTAVIPEIEARS